MKERIPVALDIDMLPELSHGICSKKNDPTKLIQPAPRIKRRGKRVSKPEKKCTFKEFKDMLRIMKGQ